MAQVVRETRPPVCRLLVCLSAFSNLPRREGGTRNTKTHLDEHYFKAATVSFSSWWSYEWIIFRFTWKLLQGISLHLSLSLFFSFFLSFFKVLSISLSLHGFPLFSSSTTNILMVPFLDLPLIILPYVWTLHPILLHIHLHFQLPWILFIYLYFLLDYKMCSM